MNKQTQTKMFDFSDTDLDFCAGSKNKFPTVFKKMFAHGYNSKVVSSVSVVGDQVTLDYGVNHGYVADRVLAINTPGLVGEFYIDSVTSNTVTLTVPGALTGIAGGFTTKVAPLGYELVYEQGNIHIYKFKAMDESDLYLRLCFQDNASYKNMISPCIGKTVDLAAGIINDSFAYSTNASLQTPSTGLCWLFAQDATSTYNNYTYAQGLNIFGKGLVVGSKYHFAVMNNNGRSSTVSAKEGAMTGGFFPTACFNSDVLSYPVLLGLNGITASTGTNIDTYSSGAAYLGNQRVRFNKSNLATGALFITPQAASSFLPSDIDDFNTTVAENLSLYDFTSTQFLGYVSGGVFACNYASSNAPTLQKNLSPILTVDIDLNNIIAVHAITFSSVSVANAVFLAFPVEEIKIGS